MHHFTHEKLCISKRARFDQFQWKLLDLLFCITPSPLSALDVFEETQYYEDLSDAMVIAKATKSWLAVKQVKNKSKVKQLIKNQKLGKGEAEAIILCKELRALAVLTSQAVWL